MVGLDNILKWNFYTLLMSNLLFPVSATARVSPSSPKASPPGDDSIEVKSLGSVWVWPMHDMKLPSKSRIWRNFISYIRHIFLKSNLDPVISLVAYDQPSSLVNHYISGRVETSRFLPKLCQGSDYIERRVNNKDATLSLVYWSTVLGINVIKWSLLPRIKASWVSLLKAMEQGERNDEFVKEWMKSPLESNTAMSLHKKMTNLRRCRHEKTGSLKRWSSSSLSTDKQKFLLAVWNHSTSGALVAPAMLAYSDL